METASAGQPTWAENFLQHIPLFEKCSTQDIQTLALNMRNETYRKGETVLFQGVISNQLYFVISGMVGVYARKDKVTRFIANLEKGSYFGEISLIKNCAATATIKAGVDETEIYTIDYDVIKEVLRNNPEMKADLESKIMERNRYRMEQFEKQKEEAAAAAAAPQA